MFIVNGQKAILRQFNRKPNEDVFDDQNYRDIPIKLCPYDVSMSVSFGKYTVPNAKGYYQLPRYIDVQEGDQIIFKQKCEKPNSKQVHTILNVDETWIFNRIESYIVAVD